MKIKLSLATLLTLMSGYTFNVVTAAQETEQALLQEIAQAMAQPTLQARTRSLDAVVTKAGNQPASPTLQNAFATATQQLFTSRTADQKSATTAKSSAHKKALVTNVKRTKAKSRKNKHKQQAADQATLIAPTLGQATTPPDQTAQPAGKKAKKSKKPKTKKPKKAQQ